MGRPAGKGLTPRGWKHSRPAARVEAGAGASRRTCRSSPWLGEAAAFREPSSSVSRGSQTPRGRPSQGRSTAQADDDLDHGMSCCGPGALSADFPAGLLRAPDHSGLRRTRHDAPGPVLSDSPARRPKASRPTHPERAQAACSRAIRRFVPPPAASSGGVRIRSFMDRMSASYSASLPLWSLRFLVQMIL